MASVTRMWDDLLRPLGDVFAQSYDTSGKVINSLKKGIDSRFFNADGSINQALLKATGGVYRAPVTGRTAKHDLSRKGAKYKKGDALPDKPARMHINNFTRAKSLFYNKEGRLQHSRVAGAAIGFGGGAIAGLNLAGDIMFGD